MFVFFTSTNKTTHTINMDKVHCVNYYLSDFVSDDIFNIVVEYDNGKNVSFQVHETEIEKFEKCIDKS